VSPVSSVVECDPKEDRTRGKVKLSILDRLASRPDGKLVIVTAITPTKAGDREGRTVGLS
jgi:formate--tetrahydrofolate ligase